MYVALLVQNYKTKKMIEGCIEFVHLQSGILSGTSSHVNPVRLSSSVLLGSTTEVLNDAVKTQGIMNASSEAKTQRVCNFYTSLAPEDRTIFLRTLAHDYHVNQQQVLRLAESLTSVKEERSEGTLLQAEDRLRLSLTPRYQRLFSQISHLNDGVKFLVDLRADILNILSSHGMDQESPYLKDLSSTLKDLISLWFSVGFLELQRVTWQSPCDMLQKISDYEAVHPIRNWTDLKRRVGPYRRCFVFTHNSMPREPVVVLHTALTKEISSSIQDIVQNSLGGSSENCSISDEDTEKPELVNTAMFYSITSTQKGLQGIEMGNYLIKRAVKEVQSEFPNMVQFSSLSPIPGFKEWLVGEINKITHMQNIGEAPCGEQTLFSEEELNIIKESLPQLINKKSTLETLRQYLNNSGWIQYDGLSQILKRPLMRLCARYLYVEKRRGYALNPVANFHLRNGAVMWRLNWLADCTPRGLSASCGMMINYRYFLDETEQNSQQYIESKVIAASPALLDLVSVPLTQKDNESKSQL